MSVNWVAELIAASSWVSLLRQLALRNGMEEVIGSGPTILTAYPAADCSSSSVI
jgi:hypothetical protein